jgi:DNA-binding NarL/FixJ family response regulator
MGPDLQLQLERPATGAVDGKHAQDADQIILVVGEWRALPDDVPTVRSGPTLIVRIDARIRACQLAMTRYPAVWLIIGADIDDVARDALAQTARLISDDVLIAVLGPEGDLTTPERWLRRGCAAYLKSDNSVDRVLLVLRFARESGIIAIDKCFQEASKPRQVPPVSELTRREREVLHWLRLGRRNQEIAEALSVSGSTVGFHVRNMLEKLGARNRVEAINRADTLGL